MQFMTRDDKIWACLSVCILQSHNQNTPAIWRETSTQALEFHHIPNSVDLFRQITSQAEYNSRCLQTLWHHTNIYIVFPFLCQK